MGSGYLPAADALRRLRFAPSGAAGQWSHKLPAGLLWYVLTSHSGFAFSLDTGAQSLVLFAGCCIDKAAFYAQLLETGWTTK